MEAAGSLMEAGIFSLADGQRRQQHAARGSHAIVKSIAGVKLTGSTGHWTFAASRHQIALGHAVAPDDQAATRGSDRQRAVCAGEAYGIEYVGAVSKLEFAGLESRRGNGRVDACLDGQRGVFVHRRRPHR